MVVALFEDMFADESTKLLRAVGNDNEDIERTMTFPVSLADDESSPSALWRPRSAVSKVKQFIFPVASVCVMGCLLFLSIRNQVFLSPPFQSSKTSLAEHQKTMLLFDSSSSSRSNNDDKVWHHHLLGLDKDHIPTTQSTVNASFTYDNTTNTPLVQRRCEWVIKQFQNRDEGTATHEELAERYQKQSENSNVFYRATAHIFWHDFVFGRWGNGLSSSLLADAEMKKGVPLDDKSTFTWITGDQHLSNFGAFRNRHGDIVFSVNDFDEAAVYDFHVDVLRIAVSVYNHALTNKLSYKHVLKVLEKFTHSYVKTVIDYVGNEDALLFELTKKTTKGFLKDFLKNVESDGSYVKQMHRYTKVDHATGYRYFQKGPIGQPDPTTKLEALSPERENQIRSVFTPTIYGATMMRLGWAVREWDDDFFTVLDVAARIGSGVGSWGVDRYYVLLKGTDEMLEAISDKDERLPVILDVKYEPPGAVSQVLTPVEKAWYNVMFANDAARAVEAQRRLTSYTDPFTGWVMLPDDKGVFQPFSVRQRSPWKDSPDLDKLTDPDDFIEFMEQIAAATATSHVRGTVGKKPGAFKDVIKALLGDKKKRKKWGKAVADLAGAYSEQVLLDYECFDDYVKAKYPTKNPSSSSSSSQN